MWSEYKAFLFRGNLLDLAVAFILGVAFAGLVTSFTEDILGQIIAAIAGEPDFDAIGITVGDATIRIGAFLTALVDFAIVATVMFLCVRAAARFKRPAPEEHPAPDTDEVLLLREIRDALRTR